MTALNSSEMGLVTELRKRLSGTELTVYQSTDISLVRWIRAQHCNLDKAEDMLRKSLKWRLENDMDSISSWEPSSEVKALVPISLIGCDVDNSPEYGKINLREVLKNGQQKVLIKYIHSITEKALVQMTGKTQRDGSPVTQVVRIVDMHGFVYKNLAYKGVVDLAVKGFKASEANYPGMIKNLYVINAGPVFPVALAIVKPILSSDTQAKLAVYNKPMKWKPILLEKIPENALPPHLGGTNTTTEHQSKAESTNQDAEDDEDDEEFMVGTVDQFACF